jgi:transposase
MKAGYNREKTNESRKMSLQMRPLDDIREQTYRVVRAAFPKGNPYIVLRNQLGSIFINEDFTDLYSKRGQPAWAPWRLALITLLQFREKLSDRQTADVVRSRIDWKYLLGLELEDTGFDFSGTKKPTTFGSGVSQG